MVGRGRTRTVIPIRDPDRGKCTSEYSFFKQVYRVNIRTVRALVDKIIHSDSRETRIGTEGRKMGKERWKYKVSGHDQERSGEA